MATNTPNYNLKKPDATDPIGDFRADYNDNLDIIDANLGGGGGGGHRILDESGTALADEPDLQFTDGLTASDDSLDTKTVVGVDTTFTEAVTRTNIDSGDSFSTILGKIKKWFTDLPSLFVSKLGDTMTGALYMFRAGENQIYLSQDHSSTTSQPASIYIGNGTPNGTAGSCFGRIRLFANGAYNTAIQARNATANRSINFPDADGTILLDESPISVTADGTKTYQTLLQELYSSCDTSKITPRSFIKINNKVFACQDTSSNAFRFSYVEVGTSGSTSETIRFQSSARYLRMEMSTSGNTFTPLSSTVPTSGNVIRLYY